MAYENIAGKQNLVANKMIKPRAWTQQYQKHKKPSEAMIYA
jgi:hypothetical protein